MSDPKWIVGDMAIVAIVGGPLHVRVLSFYKSQVSYLSEKGELGYCSLQSLLDVDGYLLHCERMADDWTGREFRERSMAAKKPFVAPPWWEERFKDLIQP